jgi:5'-nucleotidase
MASRFQYEPNEIVASGLGPVVQKKFTPRGIAGKTKPNIISSQAMPHVPIRILRFHLLSIFILAACQPPKTTQTAASTPEAIRLRILNINDFHGQFSPITLKTGEDTPRKFRIAGAEALAATVAEIRSQDPSHTLLFDAGDFMQGSLTSNFFEGKPVRDLFSILGVDVAAVGNHEFDFGPVGPRVIALPGQDRRGALKAWTKGAPFPVLSANIKKQDGSPIQWPNVHPSTIIKRAGLRIGLIGLTTEDAKITSMPSNLVGLRLERLKTAFQREAQKLRKKGIDLLILLGHVGGQCAANDNAKGSADCDGEFFEFFKSLKDGDLDVAILGHSHCSLWRRVKGTMISEACSRGMALGQMELFVVPGKGVDAKRSKILPPQPICHDIFNDTKDCEGRLRKGKVKVKGQLLENPLLEKHKDTVLRVRTMLAEYSRKVAKSANRVLAQVKNPLPHRRHTLSPLATFFAKVLRERTPNADVALMNNGGIRANVAAGPWRYSQLFQVFPFDNQVATVSLSGAQLRRLLEINLASPRTGLLQVAGLKMKISCGNKRKLLELTDDKGKALDPRAQYVVAMSDFMLTGGDGLGKVLDEIPETKKKIFEGRLIREVMAEHLSKLRHPVNSRNFPVISADSPPIILNGDCKRASKARGAICR